MKIELARMCDIDSWMELIDQVKDVFPGLETEEGMKDHRKTALEFMRNKSAISAKIHGKVVGGLLFSKKEGTLCFLAVDRRHRRQHIAEKMVSFMLIFMDQERDITVTTYREGVPEGKAARAFYKHLGFSEGRLTEEFGSPVQEFILKR